jgi:hypothetical protein
MSQRKVLNLHIPTCQQKPNPSGEPVPLRKSENLQAIENSSIFMTADLVVRAWNEANTAIFFFGFGKGNPCSGQLFMWT